MSVGGYQALPDARYWVNNSLTFGDEVVGTASRDPARHAALHASATQPDLHGHHEGEAAARADRAEEGVGHRGPQRPPPEAVLGVAGESEGQQGYRGKCRRAEDRQPIEGGIVNG